MNRPKDDPETPDWVRQLFDDLNARHFEGRLIRPTIVIQKGAMAQSNAWYLHKPDIQAKFGPLVAIGLTQEVLGKGSDYAADTLLHEMVHHALATLKKTPHEAHGREFCAIANRIGATLGLRETLPDTRETECWPQSVRNR